MWETADVPMMDVEDCVDIYVEGFQFFVSFSLGAWVELKDGRALQELERDWLVQLEDGF